MFFAFFAHHNSSQLVAWNLLSFVYTYTQAQFSKMNNLIKEFIAEFIGTAILMVSCSLYLFCLLFALKTKQHWNDAVNSSVVFMPQKKKHTRTIVSMTYVLLALCLDALLMDGDAERIREVIQMSMAKRRASVNWINPLLCIHTRYLIYCPELICFPFSSASNSILCQHAVSLPSLELIACACFDWRLAFSIETK